MQNKTQNVQCRDGGTLLAGGTTRRHLRVETHDESMRTVCHTMDRLRTVWYIVASGHYMDIALLLTTPLVK